MTLDRSKSQDYPNVAPASGGSGAGKNGYATLAPGKRNLSQSDDSPTFSSTTLKKNSAEPSLKKNGHEPVNTLQLAEPDLIAPPGPISIPIENEPAQLSFAEQKRQEAKGRKSLKDKNLLARDNWLTRNGHGITYFFLYLFSAFVFFRPYEWLPQLGFLQVGAFVLALATLLIYLPTQFSSDGTLSIMTTEVKSILCLAGLALLTMPIAKNPGVAWQTFNDVFIKAVTMFIVMINVVRSRRRLIGMIWISLGISLVLSYIAIGMYLRGELRAEGYRVQVDFGGMLGNPNDMALHLVTMTPIVICLGLASKNYLMKILYFTMTLLFIAANVVTFSRGAFLGLIVVFGMLVWKIGRRQRVKAIAVSAFVGIVFILLAPGNYGMRLLSIFVPSMDAAGSSDQRRELLQQSILVTLRNPWGIGIGCFPEISQHNLQTHNAFTQVSSEIGVLGLLAYLTFMISPIRKLSAVERTLFDEGKSDWFYYMSIGLQASIAGFMVSSFFGPVAYSWFIYYLVAYAVAFRRIYRNEKGDELKSALP